MVNVILKLKDAKRFVTIMEARDNEKTEIEIADILGVSNTNNGKGVTVWLSRLKSRTNINHVERWTNGEQDLYRAMLGNSMPTAPKKKEEDGKPQKSSPSPTRTPRKSKFEKVDVKIDDLIKFALIKQKANREFIEANNLEVDTVDHITDTFLLATVGKGKKRIRNIADAIENVLVDYMKENKLAIVKLS